MADLKRRAFYFVIIMGIISLFSDLTYEGARSLTGPYLGLLGASALVVSTVAGLGELIGYTLRYFFGRLVDKTKRYWLFAIIGYTVNLLVIPSLALTNNWQAAALLIILERIGKSIRKPAKDTLTSFAGAQLGYGTTFALEELLDQLGATIGPLFMSISVANNISVGDVTAYRKSFALLIFPAIITLGLLIITRVLVPNPEHFDEKKESTGAVKFDRLFYLYIAAIALIAFGFADFALISFHAQKNALLTPVLIPIAYMIAMIVDAVSALIFGRLFDKKGFLALSLSTFVASFYSIFAFGNSTSAIILGAVLWGIGMGAQESILKAAIGKLVDKKVRATAYGFFNAIFGIAWFAGSALIGLLYSINLVALMTVSVISELCAFIILIRITYLTKKA
ncbi:MAG TPA: MFS transporter [Fervidobacterium sp.]|nr:MFS transporter [Fervidobacterium sp.]MBP8657196.1 MFS transporter [Fervidobacterium sp.]MBP9518417.1 MFS transporter [Fervidobacterium sp.]HOP82006.1 MFS transporter [Fervidobacterium sp.]HOV52920.1 MFS transporter [Fervidobacterium sp.]